MTSISEERGYKSGYVVLHGNEHIVASISSILFIQTQMLFTSFAICRALK